MKTFLITILFTLVFHGCSTKNAFSNLHITSYQEKSEENTLSSKIKSKKVVDGLVTAIYLNPLEGEKYLNRENDIFYVYLYTKSDNKNIKFFLNDKMALKVEELKAENIFSHLSNFKTQWSEYYLVTFEKEDENLSFHVENAQFSSNKLLFEKFEK